MAFPYHSFTGWLVLAFAFLVPTAAFAAEKAAAPKTYWVYIGTYTGESSKGVYRFDLSPRPAS